MLVGVCCVVWVGALCVSVIGVCWRVLLRVVYLLFGVVCCCCVLGVRWLLRFVAGAVYCGRRFVLCCVFVMCRSWLLLRVVWCLLFGGWLLFVVWCALCVVRWLLSAVCLLLGACWWLIDGLVFVVVALVMVVVGCFVFVCWFGVCCVLVVIDVRSCALLFVVRGCALFGCSWVCGAYVHVVCCLMFVVACGCFLCVVCCSVVGVCCALVLFGVYCVVCAVVRCEMRVGCRLCVAVARRPLSVGCCSVSVARRVLLRC